jgi:hypothetical protein
MPFSPFEFIFVFRSHCIPKMFSQRTAQGRIVGSILLGFLWVMRHTLCSTRCHPP